jgi:hypothetical protein
LERKKIPNETTQFTRMKNNAFGIEEKKKQLRRVRKERKQTETKSVGESERIKKISLK